MRKIKSGQYLYKGYRVKRHGYYAPDKRIWWEAFNELTGEADYHAHTKSEIKILIDKDIIKSLKP